MSFELEVVGDFLEQEGAEPEAGAVRKLVFGDASDPGLGAAVRALYARFQPEMLAEVRREWLSKLDREEMHWVDFPVELLRGETLSRVVAGEDEIVFEVSGGLRYQLYHEQDCCESVRVEDVVGDWDDLVGVPLLMAEEISSEERSPNVVPTEEEDYEPDSYTWTFYKFGTTRGYVTVRWYGTSNGYYSESVNFRPIFPG